MIVLINLVMMGVAVSMSKYGVDFYLSTANDYSTSLGYARNMFYLPIPVSGVLMIFFLSINIVRDWKYHDQPGLHKKA
jgi:TRAP-type C4-dicarboxylate transport system permease small subunit